MKPSGIEWIGDIPDDWEVRKVKRLFSYQKGKNAALLTKEYISLHPGEYPVLSGQTENDGILGYYESYEFDLDKDSIFVTTVGAKAMSTRLVNAKFSLSQNCALLHKIDEKSDVRFLHYALFPMFEWQKSMISLIMQPSLRFEDLDKATLPYPPTKTQQKIADYLDEKCGEIDATIAKQKEIIEKLKAYKQSLISETVTKGLDKSAPLKPSGIEWIGDIPNDWEICKLKRCLTIQNGLDYKSVRDDNGEFPVIGSGGQFDFASNYLYDGESVLFGRKGTINKPLYVNGKFWTVDTMFYSMIKPNACGKFIFYSATTIPFDFYSTATAVPSMTQRDLINHYLVLPPLSKQRIIADYLDSKCSQIDKYITEKQNIIQKLDAYKKSLIFECVTGKQKI